MDYTYRYDSPLGGILLASDGEALTGLWFEGQRYFAAGLKENTEERFLPVFEQTTEWLDAYFDGRDPVLSPPLSFVGTDFRKAVWETLLTVPYGETATYGQIAAAVAERTGRPRTSARAVGGAAARNPISLIIPCHRVLGADGSLTGYAGGTERKRRLLELEGAGE